MLCGVLPGKWQDFEVSGQGTNPGVIPRENTRCELQQVKPPAKILFTEDVNTRRGKDRRVASNRWLKVGSRRVTHFGDHFIEEKTLMKIFVKEARW